MRSSCAIQFRREVFERGIFYLHGKPITLPPSYKNGRPFGTMVCKSPVRARAYVRESREHTRDNVTRAHNI